MALPYLTRRTPLFAFIVHPRDEADIFRTTCLSLLRQASSSDADFVARVCALPPTVIGELHFGLSPFRGELVSIGCLPADVISERGRRDIVLAARIAADRGAAVIGLGALTAPATGGGERLVAHVPAGVAVTNGNALTAAVLRRDVLEAAAWLALDRPARVAVVGCTGSVGAAASRLLAAAGAELILVGRRVARVRRLLGDLAAVARFSDDLADVGEADIVLLLTSSPSAKLNPALVRDGAVVIDAAEPANVSPGTRAGSAHATFARGGRVRIPGYGSTYDLGLEDPRETFACLAETYVLAREGMREHSVGTPEPAFCERVERAAQRHGVRPSLSLPSASVGGVPGDVVPAR